MSTHGEPSAYALLTDGTTIEIRPARPDKGTGGTLSGTLVAPGESARPGAAARVGRA